MVATFFDESRALRIGDYLSVGERLALARVGVSHIISMSFAGAHTSY